MNIHLNKNNCNISFLKNIWVNLLLEWYQKNKRDLPWRKLKYQNFYEVWISEIMLQQTQVKTVIPYFKNFLNKWPNLNSLLDANLDEILNVWKGLGYYQRAKNIYKTLKILKKRKILPTYLELIDLPGIGKYSAASISSILRNESVAVVDGNIKRIISRVFNIEKNSSDFLKKIQLKAQELTPYSKTSEYCQSLMDLGSLICSPKKPKCEICPVNVYCDFFINEKNEARSSLKPQILKTGFAFYFEFNESFFISRLNGNFLHGLFSFPLSEFKLENDSSKILYSKKKFISSWLKKNGINKDFLEIASVKHNFSGFCLKLIIVKVELESIDEIKLNGKWVDKNSYIKYPFSKLMAKVFNKVLI